jgi:hypothetical protein
MVVVAIITVLIVAVVVVAGRDYGGGKPLCIASFN